MKKFITSAACMMTLIVAGMGFASCSSADEEVNNPNYNPVDGTVNTNFVFNVATANTPQSRQSSANTQATSSDGFRGISDARLLSFLQGSPLQDGKYLTTASTANKHYNLGHVMTTSDATTDQTKSHRIIELALPTQTNMLMFYGRAPKTASDNDGFTQGKITYLPNVTNANATDLTQYSFSLNRIVENGTGATKFQQYGNLIAAALNYIMAAGLNNVAVNYKSQNHATTVSWMNYVTISSGGAITPATKEPTENDEPMCAIGEMLAVELATLATITPGEVRAGSGPAVSRTLGDLLVVLNKINGTTPATLADARAKAVADNIRTRILNCLEGTAPSLTWKVVNDVVDATGYTGDVSGVVRLGSTGSALDEFPKEAFNLPSGCAQLAVATTASSEDANGKVATPGSVTWSYLTSVSMFNTTSTTNFNNVYYPAEICYFGNSPIRVTNEAVTEPEYPQGVANWDTDGNWASKNWTKNAHVVSTTRSVAMQYNINYGTALLKSTVKYGAAVLQDNNHNIQNVKKGGTLAASEEPNKEITVTDNTFKLTGVLVGGVPTTVGWDFLPVAGTTYGQCIYDRALPVDGTNDASVIPASGNPSYPNYTLVWDNWNETQKGSKQNDVYVCLEFQNNSGQDFWGEHNIIRNGGTFYIIGKLDPDAGRSTTDRSEGVTWPADTHPQALPPFNNTDGTTIKERRVFIQDFMTTANFVISQKSLQHAYVTVPDLRSTQISLGLSVDLKWETGLLFDNILLGGE